jgi:hypothetical protein
MNLLNKELIGIAVIIAVLYIIQQWLPKKEGFMTDLQASSVGTVVGTSILLILVTLGIAYTSYKIKY